MGVERQRGRALKVMGLDKEFAFDHLGLKMHLGIFGTLFVTSV